MDNDQLLNELQQLLSGMEERADNRFVNIERRIEEFEVRVNARFDNVELRLDKLETEVKNLSKAHIASMKANISIMEWAERHAETLREVTERVSKLERRLAS